MILLCQRNNGIMVQEIVWPIRYCLPLEMLDTRRNLYISYQPSLREIYVNYNCTTPRVECLLYKYSRWYRCFKYFVFRTRSKLSGFIISALKYCLIKAIRADSVSMTRRFASTSDTAYAFATLSILVCKWRHYK